MKINLKGIALIAILAVGAYLTNAYGSELNSFITKNLKSGALVYIVTIYICIAVLAKSIFINGKDTLAFSNFSESIFSAATYSIAATTSLTLLSGVYFQRTQGEIYYKNFDSLDLGAIFIVSSYLLLYSLLITSKMFGDVIFMAGASSVETESSKDV
jgi:hypothetical protein